MNTYSGMGRVHNLYYISTPNKDQNSSYVELLPQIYMYVYGHNIPFYTIHTSSFRPVFRHLQTPTLPFYYFSKYRVPSVNLTWNFLPTSNPFISLPHLLLLSPRSIFIITVVSVSLSLRSLREVFVTLSKGTVLWSLHFSSPPFISTTMS